MKPILAVVFALIAVASAQKNNIPDCTQNGVYTITNPHELFGCKGIGVNRYLDITWNINLDTPRLFNFLTFDLQGTSHRLYVYANGSTIGSYGGKNSPGLFNLTAGTAGFRFQTSSEAAGAGTTFIIEMMPTPRVYNLVSNQPYAITETQSGGFVYFSLPDTSFGKVVVASVDVSSYQGLQAPSLHLAMTHLPSLEYSEWSNVTVQDRGHWISSLRVDNPNIAKYFIGVFLYGSTTRLTVKYAWTYNFPPLSNGIKVSRNTNGTEYWQVYVPVNTPKLLLQISRQAPGGYVVAYITQGTLPSKTAFQWQMDTVSQSYISLTIPNPNPSSSTAANPGYINIAVTLGQTVTTAGYILQADW
jgi:hypothetical protein